MKKSNNLTGAAGEYFACAELSRKGYVALRTNGNNPLFDLIATTEKGAKAVSIQVKTRSVENELGWKMGKGIAYPQGNANLFVILVNMDETGVPDFYVYSQDELARRVAEEYAAYLAQPKRDGTPRKDVGFRWFDEKHFTDDDRAKKNNWGPIEAALDS